MNKLVIPGFPTCSEQIRVPDMAELLYMPNFVVAEADTVWKYGTDFQRKILSMCNLKHNRRHVTVYSSIHVVAPSARPITQFSKSNIRGNEWHIDGLLPETLEHHDPQETVHLFLGNASKPTEFQKTPIEIVDPSVLAMTRQEFTNWINWGGKHLIDGQAIENGRVYEFSNHIHRAVVPDSPEFRFTFRVRETDRDDLLAVDGQMPTYNRYFDVDAQEWKTTIYQQKDGGIVIDYPREWLNY